MAEKTGKTAEILIGSDTMAYVTDVSLDQDAGPLETTPIGVSDTTYVVGVRDTGFTGTATFDESDTAQAAYLAGLVSGTADAAVTVVINWVNTTGSVDGITGSAIIESRGFATSAKGLSTLSIAGKFTGGVTDYSTT